MDSNGKSPIEEPSQSKAHLEISSTERLCSSRSTQRNPSVGQTTTGNGKFLGVVGSALALVGIIVFANHFDNGPTPRDEQRRQVGEHDMTEQELAQKAKALKLRLQLDNNQARLVKSE